MIQVCLILLMTQLLTSSKCDICDPDIPSRTLRHNIQNDIVPGTNLMEPGKCEPGHHRTTDTNVCVPCPVGTFITRQMSEMTGYWSCETCLVPEEHKHEITAEPCNSTRDTNVLCKSGYYRELISAQRCDGICNRCIECGVGTKLYHYEAQPCSNYSNAICCKYADMKLINGMCVDTSTATIPDLPTATNIGNAALGIASGIRYISYVWSFLYLCFLLVLHRLIYFL